MNGHKEPDRVLVTGGTGFLGHNLIACLLSRTDYIIHVYSRNGLPRQCAQFVRVDDSELQGDAPLWGWRKPGYMPILYTNGKLETYKRSGDLEAVCAEPVSTDNNNNKGVHIISKHDPVVSPLTNRRVRMFTGDICDMERLGEAMEGCSIVYHLCGDTQWWDKNNAEQRRVNVEGTRTAFHIACIKGVTNFVHVSTIDVLGATPPTSSLSGPAPPAYQYSYHGIGYNYADTKREAEKVLEDALNNRLDRPHVDIIRPGSVIGPWDVTEQYGRLFTEIRNGIVGYPAGGSHWCHANHVAYDIANAPLFSRLRKTANPTYTTIGGYPATYKEVFTWIAQSMATARVVRCTVGIFDPPIIATLLLVFYGWVCQLISDWITHRPPEINPGMAWYMSQTTDFTTADQERYTKQSVIEAIEDSRKWYAERGMI